MDDEAKGEAFTHDPSKFSFTRKGAAQNIEIHSNAYHYSKTLEFDPKNKGSLIYKTNRAVYKNADYVDTMVSTFSMACVFKASQNIYWLAAGTATSLPWSCVAIGGWSALGFLQVKYLMAAYLSQVFLIDEIEILEDLK